MCACVCVAALVVVGQPRSLEVSMAKAFAGAGRGAGRIERLPHPVTLEQFEMGITLGTGSFGRVRFAVHKVGLQGSVGP